MPARQRDCSFTLLAFRHLFFFLLKPCDGFLCVQECGCSGFLDSHHISLENDPVDFEHPVTWEMRFPTRVFEFDRAVDAFWF